MKREREVDSITMANCLMFLSRGGDEFEANYNNSSSNNRVFECKTCNRQFPSFQALGDGHRASHKKPRFLAGDKDMDEESALKPKTHECSICGSQFAKGQALGGHMRRHRNLKMNGNMQNSTTMSSSRDGGSSLDSSQNRMEAGNKRVLVLDLNLTPFENDIELMKIGKVTALVDYL